MVAGDVADVVRRRAGITEIEKVVHAFWRRCGSRILEGSAEAEALLRGDGCDGFAKWDGYGRAELGDAVPVGCGV
jgi:hypothetical protein